RPRWERLTVHRCAQAKAAHCPLLPFPLPTGEWRNWQTRRIQVPVSLTGRGGSTPPSPTTLPWRDGSHAQRLDLALRELLRGLAVELEGRVGGFPRDPCVVAGKDLVDVPGTDVELVAFVRDDVQAARDAVADVVALTGVGTDDRLEVGGPTPAWFERRLSGG